MVHPSCECLRAFSKTIGSGATKKIRGFGEDIYEKNLKQKISGH